jgi:hypothetical protein
MPYTPLDLSDIYKTSAARPLNPLQMQQAMMNRGKMGREAQGRGILGNLDLSPEQKVAGLNQLGLTAMAANYQGQGFAAGREARAAETHASALALAQKTSDANTAAIKAFDEGGLDALLASMTDLNIDAVKKLQKLQQDIKVGEREAWRFDNEKEKDALEELNAGLNYFTKALITGVRMEAQGMDMAQYWENAFIGWRAMPGVDPAAIDKVEADFDPSDAMDTLVDMVSLHEGVLPDDLVFADDGRGGTFLREVLTNAEMGKNEETRSSRERIIEMIRKRPVAERKQDIATWVRARLGQELGVAGMTALIGKAESKEFKDHWDNAIRGLIGQPHDPGLRNFNRITAGLALASPGGEPRGGTDPFIPPPTTAPDPGPPVVGPAALPPPPRTSSSVGPLTTAPGRLDPDVAMSLRGAQMVGPAALPPGTVLGPPARPNIDMTVPPSFDIDELRERLPGRGGPAPAPEPVAAAQPGAGGGAPPVAVAPLQTSVTNFGDEDSVRQAATEAAMLPQAQKEQAFEALGRGIQNEARYVLLTLQSKGELTQTAHHDLREDALTLGVPGIYVEAVFREIQPTFAGGR